MSDLTLVPSPTIVQYRREDRDAFIAGRLSRDWAARYHELFDESDLERALTQGRQGRHFYEWLAAIRLFEATGYRCVLAKYQFKRRHPAKFAIFEALVPESVRELLPPGGRPQGPDLLMYSPLMDDWFFAEAKRVREGLTRSQRELFPRLETASEKKIRFVRLHEI
jgi:hypothetical protein